MAIKLFEMKRLSSGMAATLIGMSRVEFLAELHRYGLPMIDFDQNELAQDVSNAWSNQSGCCQHHATYCFDRRNR